MPDRAVSFSIETRSLAKSAQTLLYSSNVTAFRGKHMPKANNAASKEVQMDRRRKNRRSDESKAAAATETELGAVATEEAVKETVAQEVPAPREFNPPRRRKQRRRQIDPTTCERDYNDEEIVFMQALDEYKRSSGRMFPTCSEILEVVRGLGYIKLSDEESQLIASINEVEADLEAVAQDEGQFELSEEEEDEEAFA